MGLIPNASFLLESISDDLLKESRKLSETSTLKIPVVILKSTKKFVFVRSIKVALI